MRLLKRAAKMLGMSRRTRRGAQNPNRMRQPKRLGMGSSLVPVGIMDALKGPDKGQG